MDGISTIDPIKALQLGVIGLGFLLAVLAYNLLRKEQHKANPSPPMLRAILIFEAFSLLLCILGLAAQVLKPRPDCSRYVTELQGIQSDINSMATTEQDALNDMKKRRDAYREEEHKNFSLYQGVSDLAKGHADDLDREITASEAGFNTRLQSAKKTISDAVDECTK